MKLIGKLLFWLVIALLLIVLAFYFLLQTRWGAKQVSSWISDNTRYHLSYDSMEHHFSSPAHILLKNVSFGRNGKPATLVAKSVDIGLGNQQLTDPMQAASVQLRDGTLNLASSSAPLPFKANILRLNNMAINSPEMGWDLSAQRVTGGISPWQPEQGNVLGKQAQIQISAGSLKLNGIPASNVLIQGNIDNDVVTLSTVGADIARGSLTGSIKRNADGGWHITRLNLTDLRLQSDKSLRAFFAPLTAVPSLSIDQFDVTDARLQGPNWAVTDLDLSLRNLTMNNGAWQSDDGRLSMNASEFIYGSLHFIDPILNTRFSPQGISLRQFTSRWENGMVRASGNWLRDDKALVLDDVAVVGLEYTLPKNWKSRWMAPLPAWLQSITLNRFSASRNLVIDIDPDFPWQITSLDSYGDNLQLAQDGKWGIWNGNATLNAAAATFNRVDVRRPSMKLNANGSTVNISELSAFADKGILEATATVSQLPQRQATVSLNGRGIPLNTLQQWGWPALPVNGDGNLQLQATGSLQANTPLKPTVSGQLHAVNADKQEVTQTMSNGEVTPVPQADSAPAQPEPEQPSQ